MLWAVVLRWEQEPLLRRAGSGWCLAALDPLPAGTLRRRARPERGSRLAPTWGSPQPWRSAPPPPGPAGRLPAARARPPAPARPLPGPLGESGRVGGGSSLPHVHGEQRDAAVPGGVLRSAIRTRARSAAARSSSAGHFAGQAASTAPNPAAAAASSRAGSAGSSGKSHERLAEKRSAMAGGQNGAGLGGAPAAAPGTASRLSSPGPPAERSEPPATGTVLGSARRALGRARSRG